MDGDDIVTVSESEYRVLSLIAERGLKEGSIEEISEKIGVPASTLHSISKLLEEKGLVRVSVVEEEIYEITERGLNALREGLPEEKMLDILKSSKGTVDLKTLKEILGEEAGPAIGIGKGLGAIRISDGRVELVDEEAIRSESESVRRDLERIAEGKTPSNPSLLLRRGLARKGRVKRTLIEFKEDPRELLERVRVEVSRLTSSMIKSGEWRKYKLRAYNVSASPPRLLPARTHYLNDFIELLRDIMKELGFREESGPLVELELFNFDALFQAQDHPAREIHDTLWIREPSRGRLDDYMDIVERASRIHEEGWGYKWNPQIAARLILRSQTTAVSARVLARRPKPPIRVFTIGRVFRSDVVDATHLPEFHQLDGIEGDYDYTFRDLLGLLKEVAERLRLELKFKPAYFPFTEPSVEGYVKLPNGRWLELFGAGMFRPEVLWMAGVDYPVGAWGFGVERLAAAFYDLPDIRMLYTRDVDFIRSFPVRI
ncbi:MAG: phenylalanine--tRNA ligase subunit alpha [Desulfurococcales archaeon]|nr:phenylalanine--tRNA ligase subunit alpha [Desulfurococcales archaeon]